MCMRGIINRHCDRLHTRGLFFSSFHHRELSGDYYLHIITLFLARRNKYVTAYTEVSAKGWPTTFVERDSTWFTSRGRRARDDKGPGKNT